MNALKMFNEKLIKCRLCPRLVKFREEVPAFKSFQGENYWRKPVPGFGDSSGWLLILGLAPSIQGGNRTGRIFTGDKSAAFLIRGLYQVGLASQPVSEYKDDGLLLNGCYITAAVKCVPPHHKPTAQEFKQCTGQYLFEEIKLIKNLRAILVLGHFSFNAYIAWLKSLRIAFKKEPFMHGKSYITKGVPTLYACYHPSPQNTNTGLLTEEMFVQLLQKIMAEQMLNNIAGL